MQIIIIIVVIVLALIPFMVAGIFKENKKAYKRILEIQKILRSDIDRDATSQYSEQYKMQLKLEAYGLQAKINTTDKKTGAMAQYLLNAIDKM